MFGLQKAEGDYIFFLDADDTIYDENSLKNINEAIKENNDADVLIMSYLRRGYNLKGAITTQVPIRHDRFFEKSKAFQIVVQADGAIWYGCWKRNMFLRPDGTKRLFPENCFFEDIPIKTELFANTNKISLAKCNGKTIYSHIWKNRPNTGIVNGMSKHNLTDLLNVYRETLKLGKEGKVPKGSEKYLYLKMLTVPGAFAWASFCIAIHKKNEMKKQIDLKMKNLKKLSKAIEQNNNFIK